MTEFNPVYEARPIRVLVADDNEVDAQMTTAALRASHPDAEIHVVRDGGAALDFLLRRGDYVAAPRPDVILLDIRMPVLDGLEVLETIKKDRELRAIPVVVLSEYVEEAPRSYLLQAASFLAKPTEPSGYDQVIRAFSDFWLRVALLGPLGVD